MYNCEIRKATVYYLSSAWDFLKFSNNIGAANEALN